MRCSDFAWRPAVRQITTCTVAYCNWIRKMLPIDERLWWVWSPIQLLCSLLWTSPCLLTVTQQGLGPTNWSGEAQNRSRRRAASMQDEGLTAVSSFCVCVAPRQVPKQASIPHHENDQTFFSRELRNILVPVTVTTADFGLCDVSFGCISVLDYI